MVTLTQNELLTLLNFYCTTTLHFSPELVRINFALITYLLNTLKNCVDVQMCIKVCFEIRTHILKSPAVIFNLSLIRRCIIINVLNDNTDEITQCDTIWQYLTDRHTYQLLA